jgi:hypothetical protein
MLTEPCLLAHLQRVYTSLTSLISCWPNLLCLCVRRAYVLDVSLLVWSHADQISHVCVSAALCDCHVSYCIDLTLTGLHVCVCLFTDGSCPTLSLLGWSHADRALCLCVFTGRTYLTYHCVDTMLTECCVFAHSQYVCVWNCPYWSYLALTESGVFLHSQDVRAWHFPYWVDFMLTEPHVFAHLQFVRA